MTEQLQAVGVDVWYAIHEKGPGGYVTTFHAKRVVNKEAFFVYLREEQRMRNNVVEEIFDEKAFWEAQK